MSVLTEEEKEFMSGIFKDDDTTLKISENFYEWINPSIPSTNVADYLFWATTEFKVNRKKTMRVSEEEKEYILEKLSEVCDHNLTPHVPKNGVFNTTINFSVFGPGIQTSKSFDEVEKIITDSLVNLHNRNKENKIDGDE